MISDILSVGYFIRWAYNWIQSFAADVIAVIDAGFALSTIDIEDQDVNQMDMLQGKLVDASNALVTTDRTPMIYMQTAIPANMATVTIDANTQLVSICLSGPPGAKLSSVGHGDFCIDSNANPTSQSVLSISEPSAGVYSPASVSVVDNINGKLDMLTGDLLTLAGTTSANELYSICIIFMQPNTQNLKVVR